jgi:NAD(P)-dependent dehydrogenase (short-subunit alcohol dehydrogenase family)
VSGSLTGRRALVTGGTRGIGLAIAERLHSEGADVLVTGRRPAAEGLDGFEYRGVDFADSSALEAFAEEARVWAPDVLVNNAGVNKLAPFTDIAADDFDRIQAVNVRAPMLLCGAVIPGMRGRSWGRIVNIASIWSIVSRPGRGSYSASKFGLDGLTAALAAEVASDGVLANCVSPGFVDTELTHSVLGEEGIARLVAEVPAGRLAQPEEIAALVAWLAGPENTFVSAQNIVIDGGFSRS